MFVNLGPGLKNSGLQTLKNLDSDFVLSMGGALFLPQKLIVIVLNIHPPRLKNLTSHSPEGLHLKFTPLN